MSDADAILEALLNLNTALMLNFFSSDFDIILGNDDFYRFVKLFETSHRHLISYPELADKLKDITYIKIAGPGSYFKIKRRHL